MGKLIWCYRVVSLLIFFFLQFQVICSSSFFSSSSHQLCPHDQSFALLQFKNSFSIDISSSSYCDIAAGVTSYPKTESWEKGTDCCSWDGVTCDRLTGNVIGLDLSCSCLYGSFPSNSSLFLLRYLKRLNLAHNDFYDSPISMEFGGFSSLTHLNLSYSGFSGQVPSVISHLSNLSLLDLSNYELQLDMKSFKTLTQNITRLRKLVLDCVDLSSIKLNSLLMNLSSLRSLSLRESGLVGKFSEDVFHLSYLKELILSSNYDLTGNLPKSNWTNILKVLDLSFTIFSGKLPDSIGNLNSLRHIDLSSCNFSGSIPASLRNLERLTHLDLSYNSFKGQIPDIFSRLSKLTILLFRDNMFTGLLPLSPFNLTQLSRLDFGYNRLTGFLPHQMCSLSNIIELSLAYNQLNGTIPSCLFTLPSLQKIDLSYNKFTGQIHEFNSFSFQSINLVSNNMHGPIPRSILQLQNLTDLSLSSNNLSGTIELDLFSKLKNLMVLDLSYNSLSVITNSSYTVWSKLQQLSLSSCNISEFPGFLKTQNELSTLYLSHNKIHGEVPKWLWDMGKLSLTNLDLSNNFLTSTKPLPLEMITSLNSIDLRSNLLQGPLPVPPHSVYAFLMSNNRFTGQIPSLICNVSNLIVLDLSNNSLSGIIPNCLGCFSKSLQVLNLRMNNFHGSIPTTFAKGNRLRSLDLNGNQLEGSLSRSLVNCIYLQVLNLGNNKINDTFPHWLESLPKLRILVLRSNRFHGLVGKSQTRFPFPKLKIIDLSYNQFTGLLPEKFFEKLTAMMVVNESKLKRLKYMRFYYWEFYYQDSVTVTMKDLNTELSSIKSIFTSIDMSNNRFQGEIPPSVGKLDSLRVLNFSHNSLVGRIPSSLANLTVLESLDLSSNQLIGEIPMQLTDLTFLSVLNLSQNHLEGTIPQGQQFGTFENDSYSGNPGLCGAPLTRKCNNDEAPQPVPSTFPQDDETTSGFDWKITMMGYGCGLVIGLSTGYIVFATGYPWWFVRMVERELCQKLKRRSQRRSQRRNPRRG